MFSILSQKDIRKCLRTFLFFLAVLFFTHTTTYAFGTYIPDEPDAYSSSDQHALVTPSIARVVNHTKGVLIITPFSIDLDTLKIVKHPYLRESYTEDIDSKITGTAFSISDNGLYVTNAHVATPDLIRLTAAAQSMVGILLKQLQDIATQYGPNSSKVKDFNDKLNKIQEMSENDPVLIAFKKEMLTHITFNEDESYIAIVPQDSKISSLNDLEDVGYKIETKYYFKDWILDGKDIAILKLPNTESMLPGASLSEASSTSLINTEITVYGYPGSTDLGMSSFANLTVTKGRITSFKQSELYAQKQIQVDAKISKGSSGGPLVGPDGKVIGVITSETGSESGDNFGFALPITFVHELLENESLTTVTEYSATIRKGLALKEQRRCKRAIEQFSLATEANSYWSVIENETKPLITECEELIASGGSIDSFFDQFIEYVSKGGMMIWALFILGGIFILIGIGIFIYLFSARKKQEVKPGADETLPLTEHEDTLSTLNTFPLSSEQIPEKQQNEKVVVPTSIPQAAKVVQTSVPQKETVSKKPENDTGSGGWYINSEPVNDNEEPKD